MNTYIVPLPDGTTTKLKSESFWTHAIVCRRSYEYALADAKEGRFLTESTYDNIRKDVSSLFSGIRERAQRDLRGAASYEEWKASHVAERVAQIEKEKAAGVYDEWYVFGCAGHPGSPDAYDSLKDVHVVELTAV